MSDFDIREWRVDPSRGSVRVEAVWVEDDVTWTELIAVVVGNHDQAVHRASQIVAEHAMLCAPYADDQHRGGHWLSVLPQRPRWAQ